MQMYEVRSVGGYPSTYHRTQQEALKRVADSKMFKAGSDEPIPGHEYLAIVEVERDSQPCVYCGEESENTAERYAKFPYCRHCYYTGLAFEHERREQLAIISHALGARKSKFEAHVEHTGGGCFWLAFRALGEPIFFAATAGDAELPEGKGGWLLVYRYNQDNDGDEGVPVIILPPGRGLSDNELGNLIVDAETNYFLERVAHHWWVLMQGDLGTDKKEKSELVQLRRIAQDNIDAMGDAIEQINGEGEIIKHVTLDEMARRVTRAYLALCYGGA